MARLDGRYFSEHDRRLLVTAQVDAQVRSEVKLVKLRRVLVKTGHFLCQMSCVTFLALGCGFVMFCMQTPNDPKNKV